MIWSVTDQSTFKGTLSSERGQQNIVSGAIRVVILSNNGEVKINSCGGWWHTAFRSTSLSTIND